VLRQRENVDYADAGAVIRTAQQACVETRLDRFHESRFRIIRRLQSGRCNLGLLRGFPVIVRHNQSAIAIPQLEGWIGQRILNPELGERGTQAAYHHFDRIVYDNIRQS
jgi:hypothetical protein